MITPNTFNKKTIDLSILAIAIGAFIITSAIVFLVTDNFFVFAALLIALCASVLFITKPTWLFYCFMLFYIFGDISAGNTFVKATLSNYFSIVAIISIVIYGIFYKNFYRLLRHPRQKSFVFLSLLLFGIEILSGTINNSYRPLTTPITHIASLLFLLIVLPSKNIIRNGLLLAMISAGVLSLLTILAGLGMNPFGFRANYYWGSSPWEAIIPRSIGISGMNGGLHSIYILSIWPLSINFIIFRKTLKIHTNILVAAGIVAIMGFLAILIANYRSGWLALGLAISCLCFFYIKYLPQKKQITILVTLAGVLSLTFFLYGNSVISYINNLIFDVRSLGVEARFVQNNFVFQKILAAPLPNALIGYGYEEFETNFLNYTAQLGINNPELQIPYLHNYFLRTLLGAGWLGFFTQLITVFYILVSIFKKITNHISIDNVYLISILSSLIAIYTALLFTAQVSGLQIIWLLIASSLIIVPSKK